MFTLNGILKKSFLVKEGSAKAIAVPSSFLLRLSRKLADPVVTGVTVGEAAQKIFGNDVENAMSSLDVAAVPIQSDVLSASNNGSSAQELNTEISGLKQPEIVESTVVAVKPLFDVTPPSEQEVLPVDMKPEEAAKEMAKDPEKTVAPSNDVISVEEKKDSEVIEDEVNKELFASSIDDPIAIINSKRNFIIQTINTVFDEIESKIKSEQDKLKTATVEGMNKIEEAVIPGQAQVLATNTPSVDSVPLVQSPVDNNIRMVA